MVFYFFRVGVKSFFDTFMSTLDKCVIVKLHRPRPRHGPFYVLVFLKIVTSYGNSAKINLKKKLLSCIIIYNNLSMVYMEE